MGMIAHLTRGAPFRKELRDSNQECDEARQLNGTHRSSIMHRVTLLNIF